MSMDDIAGKISQKISGSDLGTSVKLDCGADGAIVIDGDGVSTGDKPADCVISLAKDDLEAMVAGDLDPTSAFMQGKLKVEGDMAAAMQLSQIL